MESTAFSFGGPGAVVQYQQALLEGEKAEAFQQVARLKAQQAADPNQPQRAPPGSQKYQPPTTGAGAKRRAAKQRAKANKAAAAAAAELDAEIQGGMAQHTVAMAAVDSGQPLPSATQQAQAEATFLVNCAEAMEAARPKASHWMLR